MGIGCLPWRVPNSLTGMSRRKVPDLEKKVGWTISISPSLKQAAQARAVELNTGESVWVCSLIDRELKRVKKKK
jgi:hypothetical protein